MNLFKQFLRGYALGIALTVAVFLIATYAHCAVSKKHDNSLGAVQYDFNPLMYVAGSLAESDGAASNVDGNLNLRVLPLGTYALFDESLLFCGLPMDKFVGATSPFVLIYERQAHTSVRGLGCHVLVDVRSLKPKEPVQ